MPMLGLGALALAFLLSFVAVGVPYWSVPYGSLNVPDALYDLGLLAVFLSALALRTYRLAATWVAACVVGAAVPGAVVARVVVDTAADPTSHNLWPLELVIAAPLGLAVGFAGALGGAAMAWLIARPR